MGTSPVRSHHAAHSAAPVPGGKKKKPRTGRDNGWLGLGGNSAPRRAPTWINQRAGKWAKVLINTSRSIRSGRLSQRRQGTATAERFGQHHRADARPSAVLRGQ